MIFPHPSSASAEQQAIAQLKQGDLSGLAMLVQIYQVQAVHTALFIVQDRSLAEDVAQEAFLQAARKIGQFDDHRPFAPWLMRMVINAALKAAARQERFIPLEEPGAESETAHWLIDARPSLEAALESAETGEAVWQALAQLTPNQRAAVVLRYFWDQSESDMMTELHQPRATIKWWLHAARQRLRKLLRPLHEANSEEADHD